MQRSTSNHFIQHVLDTFPLPGVELKVCASDQLPDRPSFPFAYLVNTDVSTSAGIHYVALIARDPQCAMYIDSLGLYESPTWHIVRYLEDRFSSVRVLNTKLQAPQSWRCAFFALFFAYYFCLSWTHPSLTSDPGIKEFDRVHLNRNDRIVTLNLAYLICKYHGSYI